MAGEMGAYPVLCCFLGGETGETVRPLLEAQAGARRIVRTTGSTGSYVIDRQEGDHRLIASAHRPPALVGNA